MAPIGPRKSTSSLRQSRVALQLGRSHRDTVTATPKWRTRSSSHDLALALRNSCALMHLGESRADVHTQIPARDANRQLRHVHSCFLHAMLPDLATGSCNNTTHALVDHASLRRHRIARFRGTQNDVRLHAGSCMTGALQAKNVARQRVLAHLINNGRVNSRLITNNPSHVGSIHPDSSQTLSNEACTICGSHLAADKLQGD